MSIPYRTRRALRSFFAGLAAVAVLVSFVLLCWLLWLNRYVIYSGDGAKIDLSLSLNYAPGAAPEEPEAPESVTVHIPEDVGGSNGPTELVRFSGYYVTLNELTEDFDNVSAQLEDLPMGSTVMLQLKSTSGYAYYSSAVAPVSPNFNTESVDRLLQKLISKGHYVIVQLPAFQDYYYIMEDQMTRVPYGLYQSGRTALWLDVAYRCYWLNPASDGTLTYLIQLLTELRGLGVDEVVFADFRYPDTTNVTVSGDKTAALNAAAATLVNTCSTGSFCVSFTRTAVDLDLPTGRTRLYLTGTSAADAQALAEKTNFEDPSIQLVFLTELSDTRYDDYCVLRPLSAAVENP